MKSTSFYAVSARAIAYNIGERIASWCVMHICGYLLAVRPYGWDSQSWPDHAYRLTIVIPLVISAFTLIRDIHNELSFFQMSAQGGFDIPDEPMGQTPCTDCPDPSADLTTEEQEALKKMIMWYLSFHHATSATSAHLREVRDNLKNPSFFRPLEELNRISLAKAFAAYKQVALQPTPALLSALEKIHSNAATF